MNMADEVKRRLSVRLVAEHYGFEPNRAGYISCPFHHEKTASLMLYAEPGRGWHCFGCSRGGSVIDFVMELFGIGFRQAVLRLNEDFALGLTGSRPDAREASRIALERLAAERELEEYRWRYTLMTARHRRMWRAYLNNAPQRPEDEIDEKYAEACRKLPAVEAWFDDHPWR